MVHIWLPSLGVWAQTDRSFQDCSKPSEASSLHSCSSLPSLTSTLPNSSSGSFPAYMDSDGFDAMPLETLGKEQKDRTCPICLCTVDDSRLSVLRWCMHTFCVGCIEKWSLMQRFCPLCKQTFHGWFYNIRSTSAFDQKVLRTNAASGQHSQSNGVRRRLERMPPSMMGRNFRCSRPLQWKRSFRSQRKGPSADVERSTESRAAEKALQWRASIYKRGLRAVPLPVDRRVNVKLLPVNDPARRARIERRLEPWVRRELEAITHDSDPTLLVYLVLSLWLMVLTLREENKKNPGNSISSCLEHLPEGSNCDVVGDAEAVKQLNTFLGDKASTFWHELRCFAESPYSLQTYDSVAVYQREIK